MKNEQQLEEIGLVSLNVAELNLIDGGDAVNMSYYGGQAHYTWGGAHMIADFLYGLYAGMAN